MAILGASTEQKNICFCKSSAWNSPYSKAPLSINLYCTLNDASKQPEDKEQDVSISDIYMLRGVLFLFSTVCLEAHPLSTHLNKQAEKNNTFFILIKQKSPEIYSTLQSIHNPWAFSHLSLYFCILLGLKVTITRKCVKIKDILHVFQLFFFFLQIKI